MVMRQKPYERREFHRMRINAELTYNIHGENRTFRGFCRNLSHTGIQFETANALAEGQSIVAILDSKDSRFKPLNASVNIIRIEKTDDKQYRIAGKIVEFK